MTQGGGARVRKKETVVKRAVHSKRQRQQTARKPKRVERSTQTKGINKRIERLTAARAARAGGNLELATLDATAKDACAALRKAAAEPKKAKKRRQENP